VPRQAAVLGCQQRPGATAATERPASPWLILGLSHLRIVFAQATVASPEPPFQPNFPDAQRYVRLRAPNVPLPLAHRW
jgi:hypothetical protein